MSQAAARLSAEIPTRNAASFSGRAWRLETGFAVRRGAGGASSCIARLLGQRKRALIDLAARPPRRQRHLADRVLDRDAEKRAAQQIVDLAGIGFIIGRRRDDDHELAAGLGAARVNAREFVKRVASYLFVQFGQFAAERGGAAAEPAGKIGKGLRDARPALEQHQGCRDRGKQSDALLPRRLLRRQEAFKEEAVG